MKVIEIIARIKEIDDELKRRRNNDRLAEYNTGVIHAKQIEFHKNPAKIRFVFGGNRSGKSECGAVEAVWTARGIHPYRENRKNTFGWVISLTYEVQRDVAQAKILNYLNPDWIVDIVMQSGRKASPEYGIIDHIIIKNIFGGNSKIGFKSIEQGRERFQGASLDYVWFDEEPPEDIYNECVLRLMDKGGSVWCTMTPLKGLTWVHDKIYLNPSASRDIWHITMEWRDNPYLPKAEIEWLLGTLSAEELESRNLGKFKASSGLVYSEFDTAVHVIEPFEVPPEWYDNISIDPGLNNPLSAHFYAVDYDGNIYVIAEHYEAGRDIDYHAKVIKAIAGRLNWHRDAKGRLCALIDSAAGQHTLASSKSVAELFSERDILVNMNVNKELWSGIARVRSLFGSRPPKIFIFSVCSNLIRELKTYRWGDGDTPKKADDHALDELRYYIMSKPEPCKPVSVKTAVQKDKEKLMRRNKLNIF